MADTKNSNGIKIVKTYKDKIWGSIELSELAVKIINTPEFQRMDKIKQLGFSNLIHRDAKHTRFQHMIGVYGIVKRILQKIWKNHERFELDPPLKNKDKFDLITEVVAIAGLLHDITHIPYGHTLEDEFREMYIKHDDIKSTRLYYLLYDSHGNIAKIFNVKERYFSFISNSDLRDLIFLILKFDYKIEKNREYTNFEGLLDEAINGTSKRETKKMLTSLREKYDKMKREKLFEPYMSDIISNTICADIIDYLKRDGAHTIGFKDYSEVEDYFIIKKDSITDEKHLVIRLFTREEPKPEVLNQVIDMMRDRYSMAQRVYYCNTKMEADVILGKVLSIIGPPPDLNPYTNPKNKKSNDWETNLSYHWKNRGGSVLAMNDETILEYCYSSVEQEEEGKAKQVTQLLNMLDSRKLPRLAVIIPYGLAENEKVSLNLPDKRTDTNIFQVLKNTFREPSKDLPKVDKVIEGAINDIFKDKKIHVLTFCPSFKPRAKEMETFVEIDKDDVRPLHILKEEEHSYLLPNQIADIKNLDKMYEELWKFYLLLYPDDRENELVQYAVTLKFWMALDEKLGEKISIGNDTIKKIAFPSFKSPHKILEEWLKKNELYCHEDRDSEMYREMDSDAASVSRKKDWGKWINKIMEIKDEVSSLDEFCSNIIFENNLHKLYEKNEKVKIKETEPGEIWQAINKQRDKDSSLLAKGHARLGEGKERRGIYPYQLELREARLLEDKR